MKLRPYQTDAFHSAFRMLDDHRSTIIVAATGLGKGLLIARIAERMVHEHPGKIVMVFVNRSKIVKQLYKHCSRNKDMHIAIEMAERRVDMQSAFLPNIIVGTVQTQSSGGDGLGRMSKVAPEQVCCVLADEFHNFNTPTSRRVLDYYMSNPDCKLVGFTATPKRHDGKAMGMICESVACNYDIEWAVKEGWLVKPMQFMATVAHLDISGVGTVAGDFNAGQLSEELTKDKPLYEIAAVAVKECKDMKTLVFTVSVKQAEALTDVINSMKPNTARFVCGKTPEDERDTLYDDFYHKRFQFLVSVGVLLEGFDDPGIECIVDAAMTKSVSRYIQKLGRGLRPAEAVSHTLNDCVDADDRKAHIAASAKKVLYYIDMVGVSGRHKLISVIDVLGGDYSDEVRERAKKIAVKKGDKGEAVDIEDVLAKAEAELAIEKARQAARRAKIKADATYTLHSIDPFNAYDLKRVESPPTHSTGKRLTDKQKAILERNGIKNYDTMNIADAKKLIDRIMYGYQNDMATLRQQAMLKRFGYNAPMKRSCAKAVLDAEFARRKR